MSILDYFPTETITVRGGEKPTTRKNPPKKNIADDIKNLVSGIIGAYKNRQNVVEPTPVETPSAVLGSTTPDPEQIARQMTMNYDPYIADPELVARSFPQGIPQPNMEEKLRMLDVSPEDATRSAIVKLGETGEFSFTGDYAKNKNKTIDRGPNQINSGTFEWMWNQEGNKRGTYPYREIMKSNGISSFEDMRDPVKNEKMMDLIRDVQGYGAWYGPPNKGFDLNR